jgi:hypothetical protein
VRFIKLINGARESMEKANTLYEAKQLAIKKMNVPKKDRNLIAIELGYEDDKQVGWIAFYNRQKLEIYMDGQG